MNELKSLEPEAISPSYEAPRVEMTVTPEDIEREVHLALACTGPCKDN